MITADATAFWAEHDGGAGWCAQYIASVTDPSRRRVLDSVAALSPTSVLEIGCHCGPLLRQLSMLPTVERAAGIDVNPTAVAVALHAGLDARLGSIPAALETWPDRSVDVLVSSYCLAYISPDDIALTLAECLRVSRLGLVLAEPSAGPGVPEREQADGEYVEWWHEYLDALAAASLIVTPSPQLSSTRTRHATDSNMNAVIVTRITWPF